MATPDSIRRANEQIDRILGFDPANLTSRPKWGEITFDEARIDIERIRWMASQLKAGQLDFISDSILSGIAQRLENTVNQLNEIDRFTLSASNPAGVRNQHVNNLRSLADDLYNFAAAWVPLLAMRQGDLTKNLERLNQALQQADGALTKANQDSDKQRQTLEQIVISAREASAKVGVAVFTQDFSRESASAESQATSWLRYTVYTLILTVLSAALMWTYTEKGLDQGQLIQKVTTKLFLLALLITATIWCGKNYKALKHQATVNRHRALSIQTFQAFSSAANDPHTKDAVLLEATRAVFGNVPTGYIDGTPDSDLKVVEIARSILPKSPVER